jgi:nucleoside-diphosphate-sugar epimerase
MRILVTGGAGFIESNLVESLLNHPDVALVRVLDNFAKGHKKTSSSFFCILSLSYLKGILGI